MLIDYILIGTLLATTIAAGYLWAQQGRRLVPAYGTSALALSLAVTLIWHMSSNDSRDGSLVARGLSYGPVSFNADQRQIRPTTNTVAQRDGLPSVPAMITGLEDRLADNPNDAKGWSLLAQSYAFIGNLSGAERAISNAVDLGIEESTLRSQVSIVENERR